MLKDNEELMQLIRKTALINAAQHDGKAQAGPIVGKVLGEKAEFRTQVKELSALINEVLQEVNSLTSEKQKQIVEENWPEVFKKEKAEEKNN